MERYESFDTVGSLVGMALRHAIVGASLVLASARTGTGLTGTLGASRADNTWRSWLMAPVFTNKGLHGFAISYSSLPGSTTDLFSVLDSTGTALLTFAVTSTGAIAVYRGTSAGTLLGTSAAGFVSTSAYRYLEVEWVVHNSSGSFEIHSTPSSGSGLSYALASIDTQPAAVSAWAYTETYFIDGLPKIDDCYWNSGSAVIGYGFLGDHIIEAALPATTANNLGGWWQPSTGADISDVIDETPPNLDTDYMFARQLTIADFTMGAIAGTGAIRGIQMSAVARSVSSAELSTLRLTHRTSAADAGATQLTTTSYATYIGRSGRDPATLAAWANAAAVNAGFFGVVRSTP